MKKVLETKVIEALKIGRNAIDMLNEIFTNSNYFGNYVAISSEGKVLKFNAIDDYERYRNNCNFNISTLHYIPREGEDIGLLL